MNKLLTLIYTLYDFNEHEVLNIVKLNHEIKDNSKIDLFVLSDNPLINDDLAKLLGKEKINLIPSERNLGKYQMVKNFIDSEIVTSPWVKMCDPDDILLYDELNSFVSYLSNIHQAISEESRIPFIRFSKVNRIDSGDHDFDFINDNKHFLSTAKFKPSVVVNENSVIPTKDLRDFDLFVEGQTKSSDVLFSLSHFVKEKPNIVEYEKSFYVYNYRNGITGAKTFNKDMFEQFVKFLKIMIEYKEFNKMSAPSKFDYIWACNYLSISGYDLDKKIKLLEEVFDLLKLSAVDKWSRKAKWNSMSNKKYIKLLDAKENHKE